MKNITMKDFNPSGKIFINLAFLLAALFSSSFYTSSMLLLLLTVTGIALRGFRLKQIPILIPFCLFSLSLIWMNGLWGIRSPEDELLKLGGLILSVPGLKTGILLAMRVMIIITAGMIFTMSCPPQDLILSLMQQLKLPPGFAYAILAVLNLMEEINRDRKCLNVSYRMRKAKGINVFQSLIPLFAINIRRCENISLAMEARGFEMNGPRTFYYRIFWRKKDTRFLMLCIILIILIFSLSSYYGLPVGYSKWTGYQ